MDKYAQHIALGVGNKDRTEIESDEENPTMPELTKDLNEVSLDEVPDGEVEDLLKYEYATDVSDLQDITLTDEGTVKAPENTTSYTDLIALAEHDPSTVDPDELAIEQLRKDAVNGELSAVIDSQFGGDVVMDTINRAASEVQGDVGVQKKKLFREAVSHATEMADTRKEAAQYAGDYVLKVSNDTSMSLEARKEAMGGFDKSRQYVESHSEAPDNVNVKESSNGALYYDSDDRGRGNIEATGPVDNTLLDMTREELDKGMDVDVNDPDANLEDALASVSVAKAISSNFDVSHSRADRFVTEANQRGVSDIESIIRSAGAIFSKQDEIIEGDVYYDQNDETEVVITEVDGDDVMVSSGDASWEESVEHVSNLLETGDWVHLPDEERSVEQKAVDEADLEDPDGDGENEMEIEEDTEEKDDPCWDGYTQVGMKEQNGEMVPNCVPSDEAKSAKQEDPCWDGYTMVGRKDNGDPNCVPDEDVDNYDPSKHEKGRFLQWEKRVANKQDPCWEGYTMVGTQEDGSPRCVPDDDVDNYDPNKSQKQEAAEGLEDACWDGYVAVGMKPDPNGDGMVPDCVPKDSEKAQKQSDVDHDIVYDVVASAYDITPDEAQEILHDAVDVSDEEEEEMLEENDTLSRAITHGANRANPNFRNSPQNTQKGRVYVDHPSDVPDQYELHTGLSEGVYYYDTEEGTETETTDDDEYDLGSSIFDAGDEVIIETESEKEIRGRVLEHNPDYEEMIVENKDGEEVSVDTSEVADIRQPSTEESRFENAVKRGASQALLD
jgi:hypothetical protein